MCVRATPDGSGGLARAPSARDNGCAMADQPGEIRESEATVVVETDDVLLEGVFSLPEGPPGVVRFRPGRGQQPPQSAQPLRRARARAGEAGDLADRPPERGRGGA